MDQPSHVDVLIIGAGISGIGAACRLTEDLPQKSYAVIEARDASGGTWDLFRYPGIRSDSDLHTLGYQFRPWTGENAIVDGPEVLEYIRDTAAEYGVDRKIRYGYCVTRATWNSEDALWTVEATPSGGGDAITMTCGWLFCASGYFRYDRGYQPHFEGQERFKGPIIHPQAWPEDLDYAGKKVVVIGSGATAVTLVPALAEQAAHVTMLQRSPTYIISVPRKDAVANLLNRLLPEGLASSITRRKNIWRQRFVFKLAKSRPELVKRFLRWSLKQQLPDDYEIDRHFAPDYDPWDQRLCAVPSGDLFKSLSRGDCSVVTDKIASFSEDGVELVGGETLEADIIVTATGLNLVTLGEAAFTMDGVPVDFSKRWSYKGSMYSGVPNLVNAFGYINSSWTLRIELLNAFWCRVLNHMDGIGARRVIPQLRASDGDMTARPWIADVNSGYLMRGMVKFPLQGDREPWTNPQVHEDTKRLLAEAPEDGVLTYAT